MCFAATLVVFAPHLSSISFQINYVPPTNIDPRNKRCPLTQGRDRESHLATEQSVSGGFKHCSGTL